MNRRQFLGSLAVSTMGGLFYSASTALSAAQSPTQFARILYSAASDLEGSYIVSAVSDSGTTLFTTALPARAHGITIRPSASEVVVFARRPRDFILVLDAFTGEIKQTITNNRPLMGHGVFSADNRTLLTTENDYLNKHGMIGVRDATDGYKKIAEFPSFGIGPHELHLLSDKRTVVVANGGILTHPETGRSKLNLDSMSPALTYIDTQTGHLVDDFKLDKHYHQLSIRHLDVSANDTVCFGMQHQGSRRDRFPLVGFHQGESELKLAQAPRKTLSKMKNYCGSVCVDASGQQFAVSSPRGNLITLWSSAGEYLNSIKLTDGCGIASTHTPNEFYFSNGQGALHHYKSDRYKSYRYGSDKESSELLIKVEKRWDNHLTLWQS